MKNTLSILALVLAFVLGLGLQAHAYRDLETGEFITKDPAGFVDGPNLYSYVNQNPWTKFDPEGLQGTMGMSDPSTQQILREIGDEEGAQRVATANASFKNLTNNIVSTGNTVASLNPVQNALTAANGKDALGEKVSGLDRTLAVIAVAAGPGEKLLGKLAQDAKAIMGIGKIGEDASTIAKKTAQLTANIEKGAAFEKDTVQVASQTQIGVVEQLTVKTESGVKTRIDVAGTDTATGATKLTEAKSSATARLTKNQAAAFPEIEKTGATVVGQGKPGFPGGSSIPPTKVEVVRPKPEN